MYSLWQWNILDNVFVLIKQVEIMLIYNLFNKFIANIKGKSVIKLSCIISVSRPSLLLHYTDVIMGMIESRITSLTIVYSTIYSDADQRKHQSSASLAFVWGIHHGPVNSPHKWPVTWKMFPFDDVIMHKMDQYSDTSGLINPTHTLRGLTPSFICQ